MSHTEEEVANICGLYTSVDGITGAKSFGVSDECVMPSTSANSMPSTSGNTSKNISNSEQMSADKENVAPFNIDEVVSYILEEPATTGKRQIEHSPQRPSPKRRKVLNDVSGIMEEESNNFKMLGEKIQQICDLGERQYRYMKRSFDKFDKNTASQTKSVHNIDKTLKEMLEETKRHNLQFEKSLVEKNKLKLQLLEIEKIKLGLQSP